MLAFVLANFVAIVFVQAAPSIGHLVDPRTKLWLLSKPIYQQPAAALPKGFLLDGATSEWAALANLFNRNGGRIWLGSDNTGVVIAGQIDALNQDAHIEIEVASTRQLRLAVIGWPGVALSKWTDCQAEQLADLGVRIAECNAFFDQQQRFQRGLRAVFSPVYRITQAGLKQPLNPFKSSENDPLLAFLPAEKARYSRSILRVNITLKFCFHGRHFRQRIA